MLPVNAIETTTRDIRLSAIHFISMQTGNLLKDLIFLIAIFMRTACELAC